MNTSFDDQASSQSTNNDQHSETSSANNHSPHSSSVYNNNSENTHIDIGKQPGDNNHLVVTNNQAQQHIHHQQAQHHFQHHHISADSYATTNLAYPSTNVSSNFLNEVRNSTAQANSTFQLQTHQQSPLQQQQRPIHPYRSSSHPILPSTPKRPYTGVDKLLLAAMVEESAAVLAHASQSSQSSSYLPTGRGLGFFGTRNDNPPHIPTPSNKSELELFHLLERANLLNYFGTFLNYGGDDVQQLSDADEEEFLEIMSLVGMTQKPLHVRRLQKALIEWRESKEADSLDETPAKTTSDSPSKYPHSRFARYRGSLTRSSPGKVQV